MQYKTKVVALASLFLLTLVSLPNATVWEDDVRLSDSTTVCYSTFGFGKPIIAENGYVHVFWWDNDSLDLYYRRSSNQGANWGGILDINIEENQNSITVDPSGRIHIVFYDSGVDSIKYKMSPDHGSSWNSIINLEEADWLDGMFLASSSPSKVFLLFANDDSLFLKRSLDGGNSWDPSVFIVERTSIELGGIAADDSGRVHIAWTDFHSGQGEAYYVRSLDNGVSFEPIKMMTIGGLAPDITGITTDNQNTVHLSIAEGWVTYNYRRSTDGGATWPDTQHIEGILLWNDISADYSGRVHVVAHGAWAAYICHNESDDFGSTWSSHDTISAGFNSQYMIPFISLDGNYAHVMWTDYRDGIYQIYYNRGDVTVGIKAEESLVSRQKVKVFPNPFRESVQITGAIDEMRIYDFCGRFIGETHSKFWDGKGRNGEGVEAGVYFLKSEDQGIIKVIKLE